MASNQGQVPDIVTAVLQFKQRLGRYRTFENYYDGNHPLAFATEKFRNAFGRLFFAFADNLCPAVVDAVADRLVITGFESEQSAQARKRAKAAGQSSDQVADQLGDDAWDLWQANRMERKSGEVHQEALRSGDAYALVWPDPLTEEPCIYPQKAARITVFYDEDTPDLMLWASKTWLHRSDGRVRINLYYPDRIEKWITKRKTQELPENPRAFEPYADDNEPWPLPNPWGRVPIFHFQNNASPGAFGKSELANVIPIQNALNKAVLDMMVAMEYVAMPQRYLIGVEEEIDENTGLPTLPFQPSVDRLWLLGNENAKAGEFPQASLDGFLKAQDAFRLEVTRIAGIPPHYFNIQGGGHAPSGEALKALEERLVKKCIDRQISFGETWADLMVFAMTMSGKANLSKDKLTSKWRDAATKSLLEEAQTQQIKKGIGVSTEKLLEEMGYTESEIEEMMSQNDEAQIKSMTMGDSLLKGFERGGSSTGSGKPSPSASGSSSNDNLE